MARYYRLTLPISHWLYLNKTSSYYSVRLIIRGPTLFPLMSMGAISYCLQRCECVMYSIRFTLLDGCRFLKIQRPGSWSFAEISLLGKSKNTPCNFNFVGIVFSNRIIPHMILSPGDAEEMICSIHWRHEYFISGDAHIRCSCWFFWRPISGLVLLVL